MSHFVEILKLTENKNESQEKEERKNKVQIYLGKYASKFFWLKSQS